MKLDKILEYNRLSQTHWWLTSKYVILHDLLRHHVPDKKFLSPMLDVGCGGGEFLGRIRDLVDKRFGVDYNYDSLKDWKNPSGLVAVANAKQLPYKDDSFSLISAVDILEHLDYDAQTLREFYRLLRPGGWLLLCVPAFMALFGKHDELFGHYRRYSNKELQKTVSSMGFFVKKTTYIQPLFFLPLWIKRHLFSFKTYPYGDFSPTNPVVNFVLRMLISAERFPLRYINFPIGATLILLARKEY